jgi:hypothetical protein
MCADETLGFARLSNTGGWIGKVQVKGPLPVKTGKLSLNDARKGETASMQVDEKMRPRFTWRFSGRERRQKCSLFGG